MVMNAVPGNMSESSSGSPLYQACLETLEINRVAEV